MQFAAPQHHQQPAQYYPQPAPYGYPQPEQQPQHVASQQQQVCLIDPVYCLATRTTLVLREEHFSLSGDDFTCFDPTGRLWFKMASQAFSLREKRHLLDATGRVVCTLNKKMLSMHGTWNLYRGHSTSSSQKLLTIEPKLLTLKPSIRVFLRDGDREPDFLLKGDFRARKFDILKVEHGRERLIARCKKQSRFESMTAFLTNAMTDKDTYYLEIEPGVDAAMVVALSVCADEVYRDEN